MGYTRVVTAWNDCNGNAVDGESALSNTAAQ